jgi:hypothetical protein
MRTLLIAAMATGLACTGAAAGAADQPAPPSHDGGAYHHDQSMPPPPMAQEGHRHGPDGAGPDDGAYHGRWVGTWYGDDGRVYSGEYDGSYHGITAEPERRPPPRYHGQPGIEGGHMEGHHMGAGHGDGPPPPLPYDERVYREAPGSYYYRTPAGGTTVIVQPGVITTTTVEEEVIYTRPARKWTPHRKVVTSKCRC